MSSGKMGFWAVLAFVISSQVGSGTFLFPRTMAPYGVLGQLSWALAGGGALCLALLFADLCRRYPRTGGPHVYIAEGFGRTLGFYAAWTYWVIAWLSSAPVLGVIASAVCTLFGLPQHVLLVFCIESLVLVGLAALNLRGVEESARWELMMTVIKMVPLVIFPVAALFFFDSGFLGGWNPSRLPWNQTLNKAGMLALWGFLGVEAITAPAGSVENAKVTIPRAIVWGTIAVLVLYALNTVAVIGLVPHDQLLCNVMPLGLALKALLGDIGEPLVSIFVIIVCVSAMNAWILAMGQVAKGAAADGFFPKWFMKENSKKAPYWGIVISSLLLFACLFLLASKDLATQIDFIIDVSILGSIFIYTLCAVFYLRLLKQQGGDVKAWVAGIGSLAFCIWIFTGANFQILMWSLLVPALGLPFQRLWMASSKGKAATA